MVKKIVLAALVAVAGFFSAQAQVGSPRLEVGATFGNHSQKLANVSTSSTAKLGFRVAGAYELNIAPSFYVAPGLAYQYTRDGLNGTTFNQHALQVPVYVGYKVGFAPLFAVSLEAGPYAEYGLSKEQKEGSATVDLYKDQLKRFNLGIGGGVALHCSNYYLKVGAQYGLLNTAKTSVLGSDTELKQANFSVSLGVNF